jgi:hypothetical protein
MVEEIRVGENTEDEDGSNDGTLEELITSLADEVLIFLKFMLKSFRTIQWRTNTLGFELRDA